MTIDQQPTPADRETLRTSRDPRELKRAAVRVAASSEAAVLTELRGFLQSTEFLDRLDDDERYERTWVDLHLSRVIRTLMDNTSPAAASVLLALTGSDAFLAHVLRMQLLVHALAPIRPAPAEAVRYWTSVAQPGSPLAYDVAQALCVNQSRPAMELLLAMLNNPATERPEKQSWMRELMLPRRDQPPVLWCAEQFLASAPTAELKGDMCEAVFAYRPDDWYIECEPPLPPALAAASTTAKEMLLRIGLQALTSVPLNPGQRATVEDVVEQLGGEIPGPRR